MRIKKDVFDIFAHDDSFRYIMKRLLESSMEESFNSVMITEAGPGYPIIYVNPACCELTGYGPDELIGKSPSLLQGPRKAFSWQSHQLPQGRKRVHDGMEDRSDSGGGW